MLNKILSNLKYDSKYSAKLNDYIIKMTRERFVRGIGLTFVALAIILQLVAASFPAKSNASASLNDIIPGGVGSLAQLVNDCNNNSYYAALLYGFYGITCPEIAQARVVTLNSTSYNGQLWSVGHQPYGLPGETPVNVFGATVYWRPLHAWDTHGYSLYTAAQFTNSQGKTYFILFTCGNLVSIGFPTPPNVPTPTPPPPPTPTPQPTPCPYNSLLAVTNPLCKPCSSSTSLNDVVSCLTYYKAASNLTQNITNANNTTANANDMIKYILTVVNTSKATESNFVIQDSIADILDYANIVNLNGGTMNAKDIVSWPSVTIPAGQTVQRTFIMQVKSPIPTTPPAADDPQGFNDVMTNVYGNTINIKVQPTAVVTAVQSTTTALPNTGPGTSIFIMFLIAAVAGYFYSNRRLQVKEAKVAMMIAVEEGIIE